MLTTTIGGVEPSVVAIRRSLADLRSQLTTGPLADLNSGAVRGDGFIAEAQSVEQGWKQGIDQKYLPRFKAIDDLLTLQGLRVVADLVSWNEQGFVGMYDSNAQAMVSGAAINSLTSGPIYSLNTPVSTNISTTQVFEENLAALARDLNPSSSNPLTIADVSNTLQAEAEGYRADMSASLQRTHPGISSKIDDAVTALENTVKEIAATNSSTAQADVNKAIANFDTTILGVSGLFSIRGPVNRVNSARGFLPHNLVVNTSTTTLENISGTQAFGGTATLTATLTSHGKGVAGQVVNFTIEGAFAGTAVTNSQGVATLTGGSASDTPGTAKGAVVATFLGSTKYEPSSNVGDILVGQASTTTSLTSSANPSIFGQSVTLTATVTATASGGGTPSGTVDFMEGTTQIGTGTLDSTGAATFTTTTLGVGSHSLTAVYKGDTNYTGGTSSTLTQTVNAASTTTTVTSSANPSGVGQAVTFTATVAAQSPSSGAPTGTVTFMEGTTSLGTGTLSTTSGVTTATLSTAALALGTHSITAIYAGSPDFTGSTSSVFTQTVNQASTTTLSSSTNPSIYGQSVTFTATVSAATGTGTPTGTVTFKDGTTTLGTGTLDSTGTATFSTSTTTPLSLGTHSITAVYGGDSTFATSTSTALSQTVNQASTTTSLTSSANPGAVGQTVTFTATVAAVSQGGGTPTGTVTFKDGTTTLGTGTLTSTGTATFSTSTLSLGSHSITAVYAGDTNFSGSTSSVLTQSIVTSSSATALTSNPNPSIYGQSVTFTATVTPVSPATGTPTGSVNFLEGTTSIGTGTLNGSGVATLTVNTLGVSGSPHSITAVYSGDANFGMSTSPAVSQAVNQSTTTTALSSSSGTSTYGQSVTFTATVAALSGSGTPTGIVTFMDGTTTLGTGTLSAGVATFTTSSLTVSGSPHSITAVYGGDTDFATSTSTALSQTVTQANTTTGLTSSQTPIASGQPLTLTATDAVTPVSPGAGTPTGTVTFMDGTTTLGTGTLSAGVATFVTSSLSVGTHSLTAVYGGDTNFIGSTSSPLSQEVD
ncbi:MAG: beta strand repeat-containing protein [Isosphaeraceae bacterium]